MLSGPKTSAKRLLGVPWWSSLNLKLLGDKLGHDGKAKKFESQLTGENWAPVLLFQVPCSSTATRTIAVWLITPSIYLHCSPSSNWSSEEEVLPSLKPDEHLDHHKSAKQYIKSSRNVLTLLRNQLASRPCAFVQKNEFTTRKTNWSLNLQEDTIFPNCDNWRMLYINKNDMLWNSIDNQ